MFILPKLSNALIQISKIQFLKIHELYYYIIKFQLILLFL